MPTSRLLRLVAVAGVTTIFALLFIRHVDAGATVRELARLPLWAVFGAFAALVANLGFVWLRWRLLLGAAGFAVRPGRLFVALAAGMGANNVLPARAGDLLRLDAVRTEGVPAFVVAGTLLAERLLDGLVLAAWLLVGVLLLGVGGPLFLTALALMAGSALGVAFAAFAAARPASVRALARRLAIVLPRRLATHVEGAAAGFAQGLGSFRGLRVLGPALAASAGIWLADLAVYVALGAGLGLGATPGQYLALEGVGNLALAVPATAAGVGSFDYLTLVTAVALSVPAARGAGFVVAVHAFTVVPVTVLGLLLLERALMPRFGASAGEPARA